MFTGSLRFRDDDPSLPGRVQVVPLLRSPLHGDDDSGEPGSSSAPYLGAKMLKDDAPVSSPYGVFIPTQAPFGEGRQPAPDLRLQPVRPTRSPE